MPKQYVLFGRLLPPMSTRRITALLAAVFVFATVSVMITLPGAVPTGPSLSKFADHKFSMPPFSASRPKWTSSWTSPLNPFRPKSHAPPRQKNDTHADLSWFADWKWLSTPFSSSFTLDEGRSLLPPLPERPPVYCYYDNSGGVGSAGTDKELADAESALLLTWRRAWWAQGFRPVILSAAEATNNPRYEELQRLPTTDAAKTDLMRWLAWENMGGGLLAQYTTLPMGARDDALLTFLRRGEYPELTRWASLGDGLLAGTKADVAHAIKLALGSATLEKAESFLEALPQGQAAAESEAEADAGDTGDSGSHERGKKRTKDYPFVVDRDKNAVAALAYYDRATLASKYGAVAEALEKDLADGLGQLNRLIGAHLQVAWQNVFSAGIAVLKPRPAVTTSMVAPALALARRLAQCAPSPLSASCPPNMPRCAPCVARQPLRISTPPTYRNKTDLFTIGAVPHPYTFQTLAHAQGAGSPGPIDLAWVRRTSVRDGWLADITKELLGTGVSGAARVLRFKRAVAGSEYGRAHTYWFAVETVLSPSSASEAMEAVDWHFGFAVPASGEGLDDGQSPTPVPGPERPKPPTPVAGKDGKGGAPDDDASRRQLRDDGPVASDEALAQERVLLQQTTKAVMDAAASKGKAGTAVGTMVEVVEAWNLADTEAWRFARAYLAREHVERAQWEKEEAGYVGGAGSEKGRRRGLWS